MLYNGVDASMPGAPIPRGTSLLFVYVGERSKPGAPDTPYIWTAEDCNRYMSPDGDLYAGSHLRIIPIYTMSYPGDPADDARNATDAMRAMGWTMTDGRLLYWDAELLVDPDYCDQLSRHCAREGARLGKYGSLSTIEDDPPVPGGTWFAQYVDKRPDAIPSKQGVAWQWASPEQVGGSWDHTIAKRFVYENAGRGPRWVNGQA